MELCSLLYLGSGKKFILNYLDILNRVFNRKLTAVPDVDFYFVTSLEATFVQLVVNEDEESEY